MEQIGKPEGPLCWGGALKQKTPPPPTPPPGSPGPPGGRLRLQRQQPGGRQHGEVGGQRHPRHAPAKPKTGRPLLSSPGRDVGHTGHLVRCFLLGEVGLLDLV